jgi:N-acetylglucosamine-6-phosphate deacetylase
VIFVSPAGLSTFSPSRVARRTPGTVADVVVLDDRLEVVRVLVDGADALG